MEVRSREEILATLDSQGSVDNLPFMPEMLAFCGQRLTVEARADKTCDTINFGGLRRMRNTVHLVGTRCSGSAHGGCEAGCQLFWNEAWLRFASDNPTAQGAAQPTRASGGTDGALAAATRQPGSEGEPEPRYRCQATELLKASAPLRWWELGQYVRDVRSGNIGAWLMLKSMFWSIAKWARMNVRGHRLQVWLFNTIQHARGGTPVMNLGGDSGRTPAARLDLAPGESVTVKSVEAIRQTLNQQQRNRGLYFDLEMTPFCGRTFTVRSRVTRIIDEASGRMRKIPGDCVILDGVVCTGRYHTYCPRAIFSYWREIWLERAPSAPPSSVS